MASPPSVSRRARWVVPALCAGTTLSAVNSGMIAVSLATLRSDFHVDVPTVSAVITAYYLASATLQPLMGRFADRFGARRVFAAGMLLVMLAGALGPFAPTIAWVVAARVLLAVGASAAFPSAAAMVRALPDASNAVSAKRVARIQLIDTASAAVGPILGGVLLIWQGWPAIFWINLPLAGIALISTLALAPRDPARKRVPLRQTLVDTDLVGVALFAGTLVTLLLFLLEIRAEPNWWLAAVAIVTGALFAWRERQAHTPFIDVRMLASNTPLLRVYALFLLGSLVFYSVLFGIPQYLEDYGNFRTDIVGLLMLPLAAFSLLMLPLVERAIDRFGTTAVLVTGATALALGASSLFFLVADVSPWTVLAVTAAVGLPYGVVLIAIAQSLSTASPPGRAGQAAGLFQTSRSIGCVGSGIVVGVAFTGGTGSNDWFDLAVAVTALAAVFLLVCAIWRPRGLSAPRG